MQAPNRRKEECPSGRRLRRAQHPRIPPSSDGLVRTNVGVLNAGGGRNVVPPNAHMKIETRGATEDALSTYTGQS
jgi:metal-dependent amidase/aminoacylase/carboxypeptidase family protein